MTFAIGLAAALIPQPGGKYYTLRFVDERGLAYGKTEVSYSIFGGDGPNRIGAAQTSSDGSLPIILYGYEWGHLGLSGGKEDVLFEPFSEEGVSGIRVSHDGLQRFLKHKSKDVIEIHRTDKPQ